MILRRVPSLVRLGLILVLGQPVSRAAEPVVATGANVDETRVTRTLHVDPGHPDAADDEQHGAPDAPFATLAYACKAAAKAKDLGVGVKLVLASGTYRETAEIPAPANGKPDTDAPLVIEAAERAQAVIDGADTQGWSPSTWQAEGSGWTHPWPFVQPPSPPLASRHARATGTHAPPTGAAYEAGNLLVVNGSVERMLNDPSAVPATDGTWEVLPGTPPARQHLREAAGGSSPARAYVHPPADTDFASAIIQVGTRPRGLLVQARRNVVIRGLLVQHTADPTGADNAPAGIEIRGCENVLVEDVLSQWNDGDGLVVSGPPDTVPGAGTTLRRVMLLHNGHGGLVFHDARNLLAEDCDVSFNHYRGEWANRASADGPAGLQTLRVDGATLRRLHATGNAGPGIRCVQTVGLTLEDAALRDNVVAGAVLEDCAGPTLFRRSSFMGTRRAPTGTEDAAVSVRRSADFTLESCLLVNEALPALALSDTPLHPTPTGVAPTRAAIRDGKTAPTQTAALYSVRHTYQHNVFVGGNADQVLVFWPAAQVAKTSYRTFYETLRLGENLFWNPAATDVFQIQEASKTVRPPLNFEAWAAFLATQAGEGKTPAANCRWQNPLFADPAEGDYRLREASPAKDWDLPGEERASASDQ